MNLVIFYFILKNRVKNCFSFAANFIGSSMEPSVISQKDSIFIRFLDDFAQFFGWDRILGLRKGCVRFYGLLL